MLNKDTAIQIVTSARRDLAFNDWNARIAHG